MDKPAVVAGGARSRSGRASCSLEGCYGRRLEGSTDAPFFGELGAGVPELVERAWETARAGGAR